MVGYVFPYSSTERTALVGESSEDESVRPRARLGGIGHAPIPKTSQSARAHARRGDDEGSAPWECEVDAPCSPPSPFAMSAVCHESGDHLGRRLGRR